MGDIKPTCGTFSFVSSYALTRQIVASQYSQRPSINFCPIIITNRSDLAPVILNECISAGTGSSQFLFTIDRPELQVLPRFRVEQEVVK